MPGRPGGWGLPPCLLGGAGTLPLPPTPMEPVLGGAPVDGVGGDRASCLSVPCDEVLGALLEDGGGRGLADLKEPRVGKGGPSLLCPGDVARFGGRGGGESIGLPMGDTRVGRGGAANSLSRLSVRPTGGGGRSERVRGEPCLLPLDTRGEAVEECWGMGGRGPLGTAGRGGARDKLSTRDGVSSPRSAASTAAPQQK